MAHPPSAVVHYCGLPSRATLTSDGFHRLFKKQTPQPPHMWAAGPRDNRSTTVPC